MSPRLRALLLVAGAAVLAVAAVVGITLATRQSPTQPKPLPGRPPLPAPLRTPFAGTIRAAFAAWPRGTLDRMERLATDQPRDATVQLCLGIALVYAGYDTDAETALQAAKTRGRDTVVEQQADSLLHPEYFPGYPTFAYDGPDPLLRRGSQLQAEGHQHSAERFYERAARLEPASDQAQVAAAVGRFDKGDLTPAFSQLGPLAKRFPHSQTVRYYLGLLLGWTAQRDAAVAQFRQALALGPRTQLGRNAAEFLRRLQEVRTGSAGK
jgi:hypothetical protein